MNEGEKLTRGGRREEGGKLPLGLGVDDLVRRESFSPSFTYYSCLIWTGDKKK